MSIMIKHQHINTQCPKTFYVRNSRVLVTVKPFQPGQIFVGGLALEWGSFQVHHQVGSSLTHKH
jgi:hypothetical protein